MADDDSLDRDMDCLFNDWPQNLLLRTAHHHHHHYIAARWEFNFSMAARLNSPRPIIFSLFTNSRSSRVCSSPFTCTAAAAAAATVAAVAAASHLGSID